MKESILCTYPADVPVEWEPEEVEVGLLPPLSPPFDAPEVPVGLLMSMSAIAMQDRLLALTRDPYC